MNNVYDALNQQTQSKKNNSVPAHQPRMSKQEYAKYMKDKRTSLFHMANEETMKVVSSPESFLRFLEMQAKMDYTVTNTLLIMAQYPEATLLKDFSHWQESKASIVKGSKGIEILEPSGEYTRRDGSIGISYNPKTVFDVSQILNGERFIEHPPQYTSNELVSAIIYKTDIKPEVVAQDSKLPSDVFFDEQSQTVFVKEGQQPFNMINGLLREYAYVECYHQGQSRNNASFVAESAAYLLSKKYHLENYDTSFSQGCMNYFNDMEQFTTKKELESIKSISSQINERIEHGLYALQQARQDKKVERNIYTR